MQPQTFLREKFDVLFIGALFLITFSAFILNPFPDITIWLKDICQAFLYALLALVGVRVRSAAAIGSASTESGDIITTPPPADPAKDTQNETPKD